MLKFLLQGEIVLEGYVNIGETRREGPFGDHTGYYSLADDYQYSISLVSHIAKILFMRQLS